MYLGDLVAVCVKICRDESDGDVKCFSRNLMSMDLFGSYQSGTIRIVPTFALIYNLQIV